MAQFVIIEGPGISEIYTLSTAGVDRIGSGPEDTIRLALDSIGAGAAEVFRQDGRYRIRAPRDDGGLLWNGLPLEGKQPLAHGDIVMLGGVTLLYNEFDAEADAAPPAEQDVVDDSGLQRTIKSRQGYFANAQALMESLCQTADPALYLGSLLKATNALLSNLDLHDLLERLLEIIFEVIPADRGAVLTRSETGRAWRPVVARQRDGRPVRGKVASRSIIQEVLDTREGVLTKDAMTDDRFSLQQSIVSQNIHAALCVPLIGKTGEVEGLIYVDKITSGRGFTIDHLRLLTGVAMEATLAIENARLVAEVGEKKRLERELDIAAGIQMNLIPARAPEVPGLAVAGVMIPAREVGGDYYDFVLSEDGSELFIVIGDVSGKGVPAGLVMVMARSFFRPLIQFTSSTQMLVDELNKLLARDTGRNMFMTMLVLCYDVEQQTISWTGAGHEHLLVYRAAGGAVERIQAGGVPLGMREDCSAYFELHELVLAPGDAVLLYTDGVTEARGPGDREFSLDLTAELLARHGGRDADELVQYVLGDLRRFMGQTEQHDDITLVALKKKGQ